MPAPAGTLAASAHEVEKRLLRLTGPDLGLRRERLIVGAVAVAAVVMVPLALAAAPAIALAWEGICLVG
ncbi:hypothetical protein G5V59_19385 [Nocardioides sp. W3-2-3]|uniref:hypothetical protein n=1 Tax=Nocardioides convexus TaxID=2712224 RepID=UPI002418A98F|nr:hypothetical protein [Nocardioides convexus]NHA01283.1 hypothetical protein [Nocardioides convexus]